MEPVRWFDARNWLLSTGWNELNGLAAVFDSSRKSKERVEYRKHTALKTVEQYRALLAGSR